MAARLFSRLNTNEFRALQIYQILIGLAHNRQTLTYLGLASLIGYRGAGVFAQKLTPIMLWCQKNGLPPLTVLIVKGNAGQPGVGLTTLVDLNRDREAVYKQNWYDVVPPTVEELSAAAVNSR